MVARAVNHARGARRAKVIVRGREDPRSRVVTAEIGQIVVDVQRDPADVGRAVVGPMNPAIVGMVDLDRFGVAPMMIGEVRKAGEADRIGIAHMVREMEGAAAVHGVLDVLTRRIVGQVAVVIAASTLATVRGVPPMGQGDLPVGTAGIVRGDILPKGRRMAVTLTVEVEVAVREARMVLLRVVVPVSMTIEQPRTGPKGEVARDVVPPTETATTQMAKGVASKVTETIGAKAEEAIAQMGGEPITGMAAEMIGAMVAGTIAGRETPLHPKMRHS